jgi:hypothetical protein
LLLLGSLETLGVPRLPGSFWAVDLVRESLWEFGDHLKVLPQVRGLFLREIDSEKKVMVSGNPSWDPPSLQHDVPSYQGR